METNTTKIRMLRFNFVLSTCNCGRALAGQTSMICVTKTIIYLKHMHVNSNPFAVFILDVLQQLTQTCTLHATQPQMISSSVISDTT